MALLLGLGGQAARAGGDPEAGRQKAAPCQACHGENGISTDPQYPILAGQHADYLAQALAQYRSGARQNPIMAGMVAGLSEQDRADLAAWFASLPGPLRTPGIGE